MDGWGGEGLGGSFCAALGQLGPAGLIQVHFTCVSSVVISAHRGHGRKPTWRLGAAVSVVVMRGVSAGLPNQWFQQAHAPY